VPEGFPAYGAGGLNGHLPTHEFDEPAVILSSIGARCGKCFYAEGKWASLANTQLIFPDPTKADVRFLWIQLNDESRWHRSGTGQPFIKPSDVKAHRVLLPPLAEQRRIAEVLDRAEALRAKRRAALAQLDSLPQSLFLDLFGDPAANPKGWPVRQLGELIVDGPQNGLYKPSTDYGSGTPILRIDAFYDGVVTDISTLKRVRLTKAEATSFQLTENDVVINRVNSLEYLGKCALIPELPEPTVFESNMMRMRFDSKIAHPRFVVQFLQTGFAKSQIQMRAKHAVNQASINQQDVSGFRVSLPSIELQHEFARRVTAVEKLQTPQRASLAELDALFATLQHRAFKGDL
jgi:type I restriction enzyme S subunit